MTLDEAIKHCYEVAESNCTDCGAEHLQLADWLTELKVLRSEKERLSGKWIHVRDTDTVNVWKCSECGSTITANFGVINPIWHDKFCYNCGCKMEDADETD